MNYKLIFSTLALMSTGCADPSWDVFADASFLYWYGGASGISLASNAVLNAGNAHLATRTRVFNQTFEYKPGFKIELGIVKEHSGSFSVKYTWLKGTNTTSLSSPTDNLTAGTTLAMTGTPVLLVTDWFLNGTSLTQPLSATAITSTWHYAIDWIDLTTARPLYQGYRLTVSPFGGLRFAQTRQKIIIELTEASGLAGISSIPSQPIGSRNYSNSWGIGPRFGSDASLCLGSGFRIEGDVALSILYTYYTKLVHSEDPASSSFNPGPYKTMMKGYRDLCPITELGLGLGWGRYYNRSHFDLTASYDFTYLWKHNISRQLLDIVLADIGPTASDLYFHGLSVTCRLDF